MCRSRLCTRTTSYSPKRKQSRVPLCCRTTRQQSRHFSLGASREAPLITCCAAHACTTPRPCKGPQELPSGVVERGAVLRRGELAHVCRPPVHAAGLRSSAGKP